MTALLALLGGQQSAVLVVLEAVTLVLGGVVTFQAYRAFQRTGSPSLRLLTLGFGLVTLGALLAGVADQVLGLPLDLALVLDSLLTVGGLAVILYSLYHD